MIESTLPNSDSQVYTQVRHVELVHLDGLATATLVPTLIATAVLAFLAARMRGRAFWLTLTALVLLVTVLATSLVVNVPINHDQLTWNVQAPPTDWASVRDRWQIAHAFRTGAALLAFGCLAVAALGRVRSRNSRPPGRGCGTDTATGRASSPDARRR
ncbi:protein of unknown function [Micromonospora purpureochromogenes]|uniref:DUF1772 domain-containing protein n=1 Tax=Micromonospora purpureochromogenes TaxID=47872 RepID=A0A1C4YYS6_9ACTN|nr:DUF1772 domain-containing protein [Micromonospora purpureochromogenes]SCF25850.1 protein of unknown function [Micromonospora purpureochromogenes]